VVSGPETNGGLIVRVLKSIVPAVPDAVTETSALNEPGKVDASSGRVLPNLNETTPV
jgi:hypothetical protein